ncbi:substrate-binding domain-containing protein [Tropicimonas aquimaris]|uniref:Substrate-binding domain-containing protein n=1 Tax=Tropicimonas aquimaris TaxID=914152 RepID=A0ABW3IXS9_9RHOB
MPDAFFCLSDVIALGALFELARQGISVPDDVSVVGFDDQPWTSHASPALTTVRVPVLEMGEAAALALVRNLEEGRPVEPLKLDGAIVLRGSTAKRS